MRFAEQIEAMYQAGARIFVEVGPRSVLSNLVRETLADRQPLVLSTDSTGRHGVTQLLHVLAQLAVAGVAVDFEELWRGRDRQPLQLAKLAPTPAAGRRTCGWSTAAGRDGNSEPVLPVPPPTMTQRLEPRTAESPAAALEPIQPVPVASAPAADAWIAESSIDAEVFPRMQGVLMPSDAHNPLPFLADPGTADVMRQFQQLMGQFLQTQALVMTAYLQGAPAAGVSLSSLSGAMPRLPERQVSPMPEPAPVTMMAPPAPVPMPAPYAPVYEPAPWPAVAAKANGNGAAANGASANGVATNGAATNGAATGTVLALPTAPHQPMARPSTARTRASRRRPRCWRGCSRSSAIAPGIRRKCSPWTPPWRPISGSTRSSGWRSCTAFHETHAGAQARRVPGRDGAADRDQDAARDGAVLNELMAAPADAAARTSQVM